MCEDGMKPPGESRPGATMPEEYLTVNDLAARLKLKPKTIRNKMASGVFKKGIHYFSPPGIGPRFKWTAIVAWIEQKENREEETPGDSIPMARGYLLGSPARRQGPRSPFSP